MKTRRLAALVLSAVVVAWTPQIQSAETQNPQIERQTFLDTDGKAIRDAQVEKIPYMLVVGDRESDTDTVSVRHRSGEDLGSMPINTIIGKIADEAKVKG